jgi:hypothetical protein
MFGSTRADRVGVFGSRTRHIAVLFVLPLLSGFVFGQFVGAAAPKASAAFLADAGGMGETVTSGDATDTASSITARGATRSSSGTKGSSLTLARPAGATAGDLLVASLTARLPSSAQITAPPGWTLVRRDVNSGGTSLSQAIYVKMLGFSEVATSDTWSFSMSVGGAGGMLALTGVDATRPVDAHSGKYTPGTSAITAPSLDTTSSGAALLGFFGTNGKSSTTPPAVMSEKYDVASNGGNSATSEGAFRVLGAPGPTGTLTASSGSGGSSSGSIGQLLALTPSGSAASSSTPSTSAASAASASSASSAAASSSASGRLRGHA